MPHSSGGGSHGGGGHGGGGSHGGHGGSSISPGKTSNRYFAGARTFVRYKNGKAKFVYSDYDIKNRKNYKISDIIVVFAVVILTTFPILGGIFSQTSLTKPKKLSANYDTSIIIEDKANIFLTTDTLRKELERFYEKTGITPAVLTVNNEDWKNYYVDLERYAYDWYVNHFPDEKHWLIVYSEPKNPGSSFNDWYWEGMQGDDTDRILNDYVLDIFNTNMQKYLLQDSKHMTETSIKLSFAAINPVLMKRHFDIKQLAPELFSLFFCAVVGVTMLAVPIKLLLQMKDIDKYSEIPRGQAVSIVQEKCRYCGGVYVVGTCLNCPHCGAEVTPHTIYENGTVE